MKVDISVPELIEVFKEIQKQPEKLFEMIRLDIQEVVGNYLTSLMNAELTHFLGREWYERGHGEVNHRNDSYDRDFTLKNIGEVVVKVPRDRHGKYTTGIIPRSKQYEEELARDISLLFLTGISTRSLYDILQVDRASHIPYGDKQREHRIDRSRRTMAYAGSLGRIDQIHLC